jgi:hypothetical protein
MQQSDSGTDDGEIVKLYYPADEESSWIDGGRSPSAESCASNSLLQQNPVISKNLQE